jgi:D-alanyl-D-alanine endopeptidase (penicillin-binding protein 7)
MKLIAKLIAIMTLTLGAVPAWSAPSFLVVDLDTKEVLHDSGPDAPRSIASITKLMTAIVVLQSNLDLDSNILITKQDRVSATALVVGKSYTRRELLLLALIKSDNGAAHALARSHPGGIDEFIDEMNHTARTHIKMSNTRFVDSSGLNAGNKSTATDLVKMVMYGQQFKFIREASDMSSVTIGKRIYGTTNRMLRAGWNIVVAKTGLTNAAGQCFVAIWEDRGHKMAMVILGSNHRWVDSQILRTKALSVISQ